MAEQQITSMDATRRRMLITETISRKRRKNCGIQHKRHILLGDDCKAVIIELYSSGKWSQAELAKEFKVSQATISGIVKGNAPKRKRGRRKKIETAFE